MARATIQAFRPEVSEAASQTFKRIRADLINDPKGACADYGDTSVARGLLRRYWTVFARLVLPWPMGILASARSPRR